jgi:hypothetical protein
MLTSLRCFNKHKAVSHRTVGRRRYERAAVMEILVLSCGVLIVVLPRLAFWDDASPSDEGNAHQNWSIRAP